MASPETEPAFMNPGAGIRSGSDRASRGGVAVLPPLKTEASATPALASGSRRTTAVMTGCALLLAAATLFSAARGAYPIDALQIPAMLWNGAGDGYEVLLSVRLPRVLLAVIVGAALAVSGATMQGLFRNPLADPGLLGVVGGASVGAAAWVVLGNHLPAIPLFHGPWGMPVAAFAGAAIATGLVWQLALTSGQIPMALLLLAGVAVNALAGSLLGLLLFAADSAQAQGLIFWMLGGLEPATWELCAATALCLALSLPVMLGVARPLDVMALGESEAFHLGVPVERTKFIAVLACSVAVGGAVAAAGGIGFVGLIIPHLLRLVARTGRHSFLLPASALAGGALLTGADAVARTAVAPAEMPVGVVMGAIGAPFLVGLLWHRRRQLTGAGEGGGASHA